MPLPESKVTMQQVDGLLDAISNKNLKLGILITEMAETRNFLNKLLKSSNDPLISKSISMRVRSVDRAIETATH